MSDVLRFVASGFQEAKFTKALYSRVMQRFGFIAHYNRDGLWCTYFETPFDRERFVRQIVSCPSWDSDMRDVEQAIARRLVEAGIPTLLRSMTVAYEEKNARTAYQALKARFEPGPSVPSPAEEARPGFLQPAEMPGYLETIRPMVTAVDATLEAFGDDALEASASRSRVARKPALLPTQGSLAL